MELNWVVMNWAGGPCFFFISDKPDLLSLPLKSAFPPSIDEPDDQHKKISQHDHEGARFHFFEDQGPGEKENDLDIEQQEDKGDEIKLDRERIDFVTQVRAAAFKGFIFGGVGPGRSQELVHENEDEAQQAKDGEG